MNPTLLIWLARCRLAYWRWVVDHHYDMVFEHQFDAKAAQVKADQAHADLVVLECGGSIH